MPPYWITAEPPAWRESASPQPRRRGTTRRSCSVPRQWEALSLKKTGLYAHQQWKSPSTRTGMGVVYVALMAALFAAGASGITILVVAGALFVFQLTAAEKLGLPAGSKPFDLVFHGGSGSLLEEIHEAVSYGVIKMNIDTDTQYAFTRPIAAHMFANYDGVLKIDGEVGNKKAYDPRSYLKAAEQAMAARIAQACEHLKSSGRMIAG